ncbi:ABC transporter ATP-binding protein/permease [bacterium]|nr:ABC transporter ATP-binding protein/permease [bacterium]MDY3022582.1 ABC transporter ATP-binding protein [Oliverpabstia sp.]MDY3999633.1 ABC transporter ATP-binding protein [Blautia sp.]
MKSYLKRNKLLLLLIFLIGIVVAFGTVYLAIILQDIVNIATEGDAEGFSMALLRAGIYLGLLAICKYTYGILEKIIIKRITNQLRSDIFSSAMNKELCTYTEENAGEYISTLTNDLKIIEENYLLPLFKIVENIVLFIFALVTILQISPEVLITLIVCMVGMAGVSSLFGNILQKRQEFFSNQIGQYTVDIKDLLNGYELFKYYNETHHAIIEHDSFNSKLTRIKFRLDLGMAINQSTSDMLGLLTMFLVVVIGAYKVISGAVLVGTLVALVQLSNSFVNPIMEITMNIPKMQSTRKIMEKINKLCSQKNVEKTRLLSFREHIEYQDVWFSYDNQNYALKGITLKFEKGKKYLILGKSGCGKSTLIGVLLGKCRPYNGIVRCDGNDLAEYEITDLCAVIQQNVYILNRSIKENIELYRNFSDEEIKKVLLLCGFNDLDIEKNSLDLSGGQKQRISMARALIRKKPILLIDEGTSAVDTITSNEIEAELLKEKNVTIITISHKMNPELMLKYDEIIYLEHGSIVEQGNYSELIKRKGKVYTVLQSQQ